MIRVAGGMYAWVARDGFGRGSVVTTIFRDFIVTMILCQTPLLGLWLGLTLGSPNV